LRQINVCVYVTDCNVENIPHLIYFQQEESD